MTRKALQLAATAYLTGDANLSNAALALAKRWPRDRRAITLSKGGGVNPPYPAPAGYRWAFVVENGNRVVENGNRVIELQRAA